MTKTENYLSMILEEMRGNFYVVIEAVGQMQDQIKLLATKAELQVVADDVKTIKAVLTDTNKDVSDLKSRVSRLERAVFPS